jgi:hypothetical protein
MWTTPAPVDNVLADGASRSTVPFMPVPVEEPTPFPVPGYTLQALLGRGSSGEVWRAVPRSGGDAVAVKLLVEGDPERQAREAVLLGSLDHPHLVRLREVVHQPQRGGPPRVALVMDLLGGGSLAGLLARRGRLRPGEVVTTVAPVAAAVAHVHEQGIVHGDLSPGNVVFTAEGRPVLTDLGVARLLGEAAAAQVTPAYVDPTVARGGAVGPASDVFGLAAAAFHALTGVAPWNGATPTDVLAVAATGLLPDLDELAADAPAELRAVIARGLAADPHERGSAAAFALDLRHACRPEAVRLATVVAGAGPEGTDLIPSVELTHQVPGRRPRPAPEVVLPPRRRRPWPERRERERARAPGRHTSGEQVRRPSALVVAVVLAGLLAGAGVWLLGRSAGPDAAADPPPVSGTPSRHPSTPSHTTEADGRDEADPEPGSAAEWGSVLAGLYATRAAAYASGEAEDLDAVYTDDSPLRAADSAEIARLRSSGSEVRGFGPEVVEIRSAERTGNRVALRLVDRWPAYTVRGPDGPGQAVPAREERPVAMVLVRGPGGWRIQSARLLS